MSFTVICHIRHRILPPSFSHTLTTCAHSRLFHLHTLQNIDLTLLACLNHTFCTQLCNRSWSPSCWYYKEFKLGSQTLSFSILIFFPWISLRTLKAEYVVLLRLLWQNANVWKFYILSFHSGSYNTVFPHFIICVVFPNAKIFWFLFFE